MVQSLADGSTDTQQSAKAVLQLSGRILISAIFLISGYGKITAPAATMGFISSVGLPFPQIGLAIGIFVETVITAAFLIGYRTQLAAGILVIYCLVTAVFFHNHWSDPMQFMHFWKNIAMMGGLLHVVAMGGGRFSLDGRQR